jgi:DTW domain-containing protein
MLESAENNSLDRRGSRLPRKRKTKDPCSNCYLHRSLCICDLTPHLQLKTKICLVVHAKELRRTTNTGRLALRALANSEMRIRGETNEALDLSDLLIPEYRTFLLYPSDEAVDLSPDLIDQDSRPIQFIVPDGNWRQASKVHYRHHELKNILRVKVPSAKSLQQMRLETKAEGMATLEAIAEALGLIEGKKVRDELMNFYNAKLQNTLIGRGVVRI